MRGRKAEVFDEYTRILIGLKKWDEALELLKDVIAYNPNYAASRLKLAQLYLNKRDIDEARVHYQKAIELLSRSDKDYVLMDEARELGKELDSR